MSALLLRSYTLSKAHKHVRQTTRLDFDDGLTSPCLYSVEKVMKIVINPENPNFFTTVSP